MSSFGEHLDSNSERNRTNVVNRRRASELDRELEPRVGMLMGFPMAAGNAVVAKLIDTYKGSVEGSPKSIANGTMIGLGRPQNVARVVLQREPEEETPQPQFPPDWQHGAPTKPVPPDPHVLPVGPDGQPIKPRPDTGSPYREPGERSTTREQIADALKRAGVPPWAAAAMVVLVIAALADPEPFTKVAAILGIGVAILFFRLIGRGDDVPPDQTA